jgi:hypothetical protein
MKHENRYRVLKIDLFIGCQIRFPVPNPNKESCFPYSILNNIAQEYKEDKYVRESSLH